MAFRNLIFTPLNNLQVFTFITNFRFLLIVGIFAFIIYNILESKRVYLIDFVCYKAPEALRVPISALIEHIQILDGFDTNTVEFLTKVVERAGIGNESALPQGIRQLPPDYSLNSSREEIEMVLYTTAQNLLTQHHIDPKRIDILITNCSLICFTPSLSSMVINKLGFRSNIKSFHLSGMGCSAGILSVSLARDLLKVHKNALVLVLSMESVCSNVYLGKIKSMLLPNCLFRMGGAAILLSNLRCDKNLAKYELKDLVRTHMGSKDGAYKCVFQEQDDEGFMGVALSRSVVQVAAESMKISIATLAKNTLPYTEKLKYILLLTYTKIWVPAKKKALYSPNFKRAFQHFCIHAGGKAVIEGIKESLRLDDKDVEASRMTLYRYGNTSSSSVWYSLSYIEAKGQVKKGDMVWQLAFGSGFKCNSAVWKRINLETKLEDTFNVWSDVVHLYPREVPEIMEH